jgi:hypothetical protein
MVDPDRLIDLMRWSPDPSRWAQELGVATRLIRIYWIQHHAHLSTA